MFKICFSQSVWHFIQGSAGDYDLDDKILTKWTGDKGKYNPTVGGFTQVNGNIWELNKISPAMKSE